MAKFAPYLKALVAAVVAALSALSGYLGGGASLGDLSAGNWVAVAISFFVALGAVFAIPNASSK